MQAFLSFPWYGITASPFIHRNSPGYCDRYRRFHSHGPNCFPDVWLGDRPDPHRCWNRTLHPSDHSCRHLPWHHVFLTLTYLGLRLAGCCHLPDWHHCGQCARRAAGHCHCESTRWGVASGQTSSPRGMKPLVWIWLLLNILRVSS